MHRAARRWCVVVAVLCIATVASAWSGASAQIPAERAAPRQTDGTEHPFEVRDFRYGDDPDQFIDVYFPGGAGPYPVLVFLHSGGWIGGSNDYVPDFLLAQIDRAKVALVSIDYRLSSFATDGTSVNAFPIPNQDVDEAIRVVRAHAETWNLDSNMFVVSGASAGGHLSQMAGAAAGEFVSPSLPRELRRVSPDVQGMMDFVGPSDLVWLIHNAIGYAEEGVVAYLACPQAHLDQCSEQRAKEASPQTYLAAGAPPGYFAYGAQDTMIPADTQGLASARPWAAVRGDTTGQPPFTHGVYFELAENAGHNLDTTNFDYHTMEAWLDAVLAGKDG